MPIDRPYRRTLRPFLDGTYAGGKAWRSIKHPLYAKHPEHYVRSFLLLLKDLRDLFDFVEPSDANLGTYSFRIHALLLRACVEVEANCKAILKENGYARKGDWNMRDYKKINVTHHLSGFEVIAPVWTGTGRIRRPFHAFENDSALTWYDAYNASKHDRHSEFSRATFEHLVDACCGLLVLLTSQFLSEDFTGTAYWERERAADGSERTIGGYFRITFPQNWSAAEMYEYQWDAIKDEPDPFQNFDYSSI
jgi:hypothetical protein